MTKRSFADLFGAAKRFKDCSDDYHDAGDDRRSKKGKQAHEELTVARESLFHIVDDLDDPK